MRSQDENKTLNTYDKIGADWAKNRRLGKDSIWEKEFKKFNQLLPEGNILDIGSGIGILDLALTKLGYRVYGLDKYVFLPDTYISFQQNAIEQLRTIWSKNNLKIMDNEWTMICTTFILMNCMIA